MWTEGDNSFEQDPPNAVLAFLEPGDHMPDDVVVVIKEPRLEGTSLKYDIEVLDGEPPRTRRAG